MIRCTFAGHRDVCGVQAEDITEVLEEIIQYTESPIEWGNLTICARRQCDC